MKKLALVPVLIFLIAALLLPAWQSRAQNSFAFATLRADVPQRFEQCTDVAPSDLIRGVSFTRSEGGQTLKVHSNGSLVVTADLATGRPVAVTLGDGSAVRGVLDVRASTLVPGWLQVTARDSEQAPPVVFHTDGLAQITERGL
ncbi:MAG TPA: hypothetical protein VK824_09705 [Planctomycetota bacterium]|nr:hypothetical protein [Planctomycetota bacterium]